MSLSCYKKSSIKYCFAGPLSPLPLSLLIVPHSYSSSASQIAIEFYSFFRMPFLLLLLLRAQTAKAANKLKAIGGARELLLLLLPFFHFTVPLWWDQKGHSGGADQPRSIG